MSNLPKGFIRVGVDIINVKYISIIFKTGSITVDGEFYKTGITQELMIEKIREAQGDE